MKLSNRQQIIVVLGCLLMVGQLLYVPWQHYQPYGWIFNPESGNRVDWIRLLAGLTATALVAGIAAWLYEKVI